jgi:RNA recognition motif-containing protein
MDGPDLEARPRQHFRRAMRATTQFATPPHRSPPRARSTNIEPSTNIFINYIPADFTQCDLEELCRPYGRILSSKVMVNLETGQSKCFGFVKFSSLAEAQAAIHGLNGRQMGAKRLLAKYAESRERQEQASTMVYVKRLPITIHYGRVSELFGRFGHIVEIAQSGIDSIDPQFWRCVIRYATVAAATRAIAEMNNQIVVADSRPIHVRFADESRMSGAFAQEPVPCRALIDEPDPRHLLPSFLFS